MLRGTLIIGLLIALTGCGGAIRPDAVTVPAIQANYPTAEFSACGENWHGLGACNVQPGTALDAVALEIQGYYQGTLRIVSTTCDIDDSIRYTNNQRIRYFVPGKAKQSCLISFIVSPEFPKQDSSGIVIYSFKGFLWLNVSTNLDYQGFISKSPEDVSEKITLDSLDAGPQRVVIRGCKSTFDKEITPVDMKIEIDILDVLPADASLSSCVLYGGIKGDESQHIFYWMAWTYDQRFNPLPSPTYAFTKKGIQIDADNNVSVIAIDNDYRIDPTASFPKFDKASDHIIRVLTVKGRSVLGKYSKETGAITWKR